MTGPAPQELRGHAELVPLSELPTTRMAGPFPWTNWIVAEQAISVVRELWHGQVLVGAFPATMDDEETVEILSTLLDLGISAFVCLQAEFELEVPETSWRAGAGLRPYIKDAYSLLGQAAAQRDPRIWQRRLDFLHLPVLDGSITTDAAMESLEQDVRQRVQRGQKLYIHCWGGHGRTGVLAALLLSGLYGLGPQKALAYAQALHDCRSNPQGVCSPQTRAQRDQVRRIISYRAQRQLAAELELAAKTHGAMSAHAASGGKGTRCQAFRSPALENPSAWRRMLQHRRDWQAKTSRSFGLREPAKGADLAVSCRPAQSFRNKRTPTTYRVMGDQRSEGMAMPPTDAAAAVSLSVDRLHESRIGPGAARPVVGGDDPQSRLHGVASEDRTLTGLLRSCKLLPEASCDPENAPGARASGDRARTQQEATEPPSNAVACPAGLAEVLRPFGISTSPRTASPDGSKPTSNRMPRIIAVKAAAIGEPRSR